MSQRERPASKALRALPSVDALLRTETARALKNSVGARHLTRLARDVTEELRAALLANAPIKDAANNEDSEDSAHGAYSEESANGEYSRAHLLAEAERRLERACLSESESGVRRVINASGVILHTNLGRAPLSEAARRAIADEAARYCTLEYDLETGERGRRGARVEQLLVELTGAEAALVVNNCAAAALLILTVLAQGGETIVSRGELVEIGGDFRVPDVMLNSGTHLVEVGTTNRTRLSDYRHAVTENTRLIMRVHPSNYRIVGFTAAPALTELANLAHEAGLPFYEDAGSGALHDLSRFGLEDEPVISESIRQGVDVVSFSGDKLLGASQAGLIVGRKETVDRLRRHPLYRALRVDKLALAALEATLEAHRRQAFDEIPVLRMLTLKPEEMMRRTRSFISKLRRRLSTEALQFEIIEGQSAIGGGAAPLTHPQTVLIALMHEKLSAVALEEALRHSTPPVIARVAEDRVLLDLRTVHEDEEADLLAALGAL